MNLTVEIPDDIASRLVEQGEDLPRRALEQLALAEFKMGKITRAELRRCLGFGTRFELDGFLKQHGVFDDYDWADFEKERETLRGLRL